MPPLARVLTLAIMATRTPSGATRSAVTARMFGGRPTMRLPPEGPRTHTRGLPPDDPVAHRWSLRSQLTDVTVVPVIRACRARADSLACGFAAAARELV